MKYRFIPAFTMLLAGLVCCIMSIVQGWDVTYSLILFYIIGQIAAQVVGKVVAEHEAMVRAENERIRLEERQEDWQNSRQKRKRSVKKKKATK